MNVENTELNKVIEEVIENTETIPDVQETTPNEEENNYEIDGSEEIIKVLPQLNYMKLLNLKNDIEKQLEYLISAKGLMDSLESMDSPDDLGKKVALSNILEDAEYKNDAAALRNSFEPNKARLTSILDAIKIELSKYDDIQKGTKFYTELFISNIEEAIMKFKSEDKDTTMFENSLDAFKNRSSVDFILNYMNDMKICDIKMEVIKNMQKCTEHYQKELSTMFNEEDLGIFENYIKEKFDNCERITKSLLCALGKIVKKEKETGKYNYVKVFAMNCIDIVKGIYDLDGGKEEFENKISELYKKYK